MSVKLNLIDKSDQMELSSSKYTLHNECRQETAANAGKQKSKQQRKLSIYNWYNFL